MERKADIVYNLILTLLLLGLLIAVAGFAWANARGNAARPAQARESDIGTVAQAKPLFLSAVAYDSDGISVTSVAVGDLNHDGNLDMVVANECGSVCPNGAVSVLLGNGDGTFRPAVLYDSGGLSAGPIAIADVNGDGHPDVVVGNLCSTGDPDCGAASTDGTIGVLLGNGDGTVQPAVTYDAGGQYPSSIAIADVNRDGTLDLVVVNDDLHNPNTRLGVLLGNGDGTFRPVATYNPGGCNYQTLGVAVSDLDGDGKPDVVVANGACAGYEGSVAVLLGNGDGTFKIASNYDSGADVAVQVSVADLNNDGKPDLLVANLFSKNGKGNGKVGILLGNGDGTFQVARTYDTGEIATNSLAVGDANGDGKLDVVTSSGCYLACNKGGVSLLEGAGDGTLKAAIRFDPVISDGSIVVADVNRDGRPDVLVSNASSTRVLLNNPAVLGATQTTLTSSINPSQLHQSVTFTAQVVSKGVIQEGEAVTFFDGEIELESVPLVEGTAAYTTSSLSAKTHTIRAVYSGDAWLKKSTGEVRQVVQY